MPNSKWIDLCKTQLEEDLTKARMEGKPYEDVVSGELHAKVFGTPPQTNRMPICCAAMYDTKLKHEILYSPPKGKGSRLNIRYFFLT